MDALNRISAVVNKICSWFLIFAFALMTVTYFSQIVLRYGLGTGFRWTEELTRYTNIALVMIGGAVLAGKNSHINVSALQDFAPEKYKKAIIIVQQIITTLFFGAVIFIAFDFIELAGTQVSTNLRWPMRFVYGIFPVAFIILIFNTVVFILNQLIPKKEAM